MKEWESELTLDYLEKKLKINGGNVNNIEMWYGGDKVRCAKGIRELQEHISISMSNLQKKALIDKKNKQHIRWIHELDRDQLKIKGFIDENEELFAQVDRITVPTKKEASSSNTKSTNKNPEKDKDNRRRERETGSYNTKTVDRIARKINNILGGVWFEEIKFVLIKYISEAKNCAILDRIEIHDLITEIFKVQPNEICAFLKFLREYRRAGLLDNARTVGHLIEIYRLDIILTIHAPHNLGFTAMWKTDSISSFKNALKIARVICTCDHSSIIDPISAINDKMGARVISHALGVRAVQLFTFLYKDQELKPGRIASIYRNIVSFLKLFDFDESLFDFDNDGISFFLKLEQLIFKDLNHHTFKLRQHDKMQNAKYILKSVLEDITFNLMVIDKGSKIQDMLKRAQIALAYRAIGIDADVKQIKTPSDDNELVSFLRSLEQMNIYTKLIKSIAGVDKTLLLRQLQLAYILVSRYSKLTGSDFLLALQYITDRGELDSSEAGMRRVIAGYKRYIYGDEVREIQKNFLKTYLSYFKNPADMEDSLLVSDEELLQFFDLANCSGIDLYKTPKLFEKFDFYTNSVDTVEFRSFNCFEFYYKLSQPFESIDFDFYGKRDAKRRYIEFLSSLERCNTRSSTEKSFVDKLYRRVDKNSRFKKIYGIQDFNQEIKKRHLKNVFIILDLIADSDPELYKLNMSKYLSKINTLLGYIEKYRTDRETAVSIPNWMMANYRNRSVELLSRKPLLLEALELDNHAIPDYLNSKYNCIDIPVDKVQSKDRSFSKYMQSCFGSCSNSQRSKKESSAQNRGSNTSFFTDIFKRFARQF